MSEELKQMLVDLGNEVKKYALGHYGKLLAPVDPNVLDRIVANGSSEIGVTPPLLDPAVPRLRQQYSNQSDDERLLRFMFAGNQVDDMLAAGPLQTQYVFKNAIQRLLEAALATKRTHYVRIARDDVSIEAVRRDP